MDIFLQSLSQTYSPKQMELFNNLKSHRFNIIKKPRHAGLSWVVSQYLAYRACTYKGREGCRIAISSPSTLNSRELLDKIRKYIPEGLIDDFGANRINLTNRVSIILFQSVQQLLGHHPNILFFDEFAFIDKNDELYRNAICSLDIHGEIIIASSITREWNLFDTMYSTENNNFHKTEMNWLDNPKNTVDRLLEYVSGVYNSEMISLEIFGKRP